MAEYEELVELGFEGIDKVTDKYHDRIYDHLPAWKKKQKRQEARDQKEKQDDDRQADQHDQDQSHRQERARKDSGADRSVNFQDNDNMSGYTQSQAPSYAPDRRQDYRDKRDRDSRYGQEEAPYQQSRNAGAMVQGQRGYPSSPTSPYGYDDRRDRGRPTPSRMRSSSYSPPRNERAYDDDSRRRRRSRSRSRSRSSSSDGSKTQRLAATLIGGLVGGFAGNQFRKGQKYDTAATITGAVLGGIASREIADKIGGKKEDRKDKRQGEQEAWEREYGDGRRKSGDDDRRRSSRR